VRPLKPSHEITSALAGVSSAARVWHSPAKPAVKAARSKGSPPLAKRVAWRKGSASSCSSTMRHHGASRARLARSIACRLEVPVL
jgi:hypothetical protein